MKQDNSTAKQKIALRKQALRQLEHPVILEAYGGLGTLYRHCYQSVRRGVVFEQDRTKARILARQRPTWAVYQGECVAAMHEGAGAHLPINLLDLDPYGSPWPALDAFLTSARPRPERLIIVVNDGLRGAQKLMMGDAWTIEHIAPMVQHFGNALHGCYLEAAQWFLQQKAREAGYHLSRWTGYYCGHNGQMAHYLAVLEQEGVRPG
jgi:hypothetical protein